MREQLASLTATCQQQRDRIRYFQRQLTAATAALHVVTQTHMRGADEHPLSTLPGESSAVLQSCIASCALLASLMLSCDVGMCVMDGVSGRTLAVNDALAAYCGCQRSQLTCQPVVGWRNVRSQAQLRRPVSEETAVSPRVGLSADQYSRSWDRLWRLYTGELDKADAVWRCRHTPGDVLETSCCTHVASWEEAEEDSGELRRVPDRVVWIVSLMDAKRMD